ncbi:autotransporter outer membrane beta-barrel domain-containing protein [Asticcacaulis sp. AC460]|uniref:autotransporter outer membrane beta-barrel domain-containing protein n=1 Tax=Asticcacaulis sp. AC460 TaxID=1282360 RepID=UPI000421A454|nr:autotransporter outer membrane beta-barrel domain-containing protein [Asticcacaulis sp. AC460]
MVDTRYTGDITTAGYSSTGALIQSVGGGGGNGGFNVSAQVAFGTNAVTVGVGVGGAGGKGGHGKEVWGIINGDIVTGLVAAAPAPTGVTQQDDLQKALDNLKSIQSAGLVVQSVGGGGGSGGFNITGGIAGGVEKGGNIGVGLGGSGGTAGNGGIVHASARNITTHADQSPGFLAQSVGGGGGVGGMNITGGISFSGEMGGNIGVGLGGAGGGGGASEAVDGTVVGEVRTSGDSSDAIIAQSLGGGGGAGGLNVTGGIALLGQHTGNLGVSIGGAGGKGGNGGTVLLKVNESVADPTNTLLAAYTQGDESDGIIAQSIGGGGGNGGISVAGGLAVSSEAGGNIMVGVGGAGGGTGDAKAVTAVIKGDVVTRGKDADGIMIQSLGGTGGNGGFNVSGGIAATSNGAGNLLVGVGGVGGAGGSGGLVRATVTGDVQTGWADTVNGIYTRGGNGSSGITFQSMGGGGGNGGFNVTGGIALSFGDSVAGGIGVGVGGFAGGGGNAGAVVGSLTGNVRTYGDKAHGVLVQSLGGSGGNGGFNVTGNITGSAGPAASIGFGLGGFGGKAGHSVADSTVDSVFAVRGTLNGDVQTFGKESYGAALQSVGGGGGTGGFNVTGNIAVSTGTSGGGSVGIGIGGFGGKGGNASGVWGDVRGTYQTNGDDSTGVSAVSQGGGGGNGGFNVTGNVAVALGSGATAGNFGFGLGGFGGGGGNAGKVDLTRVGDTETTGKNSTGVFVQSLGGGGGNGAFNITGDVALSKGDAGSLSIGIGGFGGKAGNAGSVLADVTGDVYVRGDGDGVAVQSVGGAGGTGAINITGQLNLGSDSGRGIAFGIGGFGGEGGNADSAWLELQGVSPTQLAQVVSRGDKRAAVKVQSVGGGGGDGAINITGGVASKGTLSVGIGGFGSDGGEGKDAFGRVEANLFANGHAARGLLVQSVGGGGGSGGINFSGAANKSTEFSIAFGLGGFGGDGNKSGNAGAWHVGDVNVNGLNASGIVVQSVAGGGGDGGLNVAFEVNLETKGKGIAVGVGGTGGDGANAGKASLTNRGSVFVNAQAPSSDLDNILAATIDADSAMKLADHSHAILVQSVGGGGGQGGVNVTTAITPKEGQPLALGVGGSGGSGGNGGVVELTQGWDWINGVKTAAGGTLRTYGDGSIAVLAQSVGGGGGDAGMNVVVPVTYRAKAGENPSFAAVVAVGGSGAGAGYADTVTVDHTGNIITGYKDTAAGLVASGGHKSGGILAQSVGGGGGNADLNLGLGVARNATALGISVGGATGAAGKGGKVNVTHAGGIFTNGDDATALMAQSIGGGGGNASTSLAIPLLSNDKIEVNIGRRGGAGGTGDQVTVWSSGTLDTRGNRSSGILAQSLGGGGGVSGTTAIGAQYKDDSGDTSVNARVAVGLEGGSGATAEKVEVHAAGYITTRGSDSYGILAQSIGGGGGVGGLASNTVLRATASLNVGVGGKGGTGGVGGLVKVYNTAEITTGGDNSDGILAQSIGGGGGTGGNAGAIGLPIGGPKDQTPHSNVTMSLGGKGGVANLGNEVYVENSGIITTGGKTAYGIRAQSIGGGGGFGGTILNVRADTAKGSSATVGISAGGQGDEGGFARLVTVHNTGSIWTTGQGGIGISATSIGGGGGDGGGVADFMATAISGGGTSGNVTLNFGGQGGKGGKGGQVIVTNKPVAGVVGSGQIVTKKDNAYGIFAQSLGGGGGNGGAVVSALAGKGKEDSFSFGFNLGGLGDTGGTGGKVNVTNDGLIDTEGKYSHGILAQSIGGGGGNGGMVIAAAVLIKAPTKSPLIAIGGSGGDGGNSDTVTVTNNGTIVTRGVEAHGIFAQSVGGGGGNSSMGFSASGNPYTLVGSNALAALIGALTSGNGGIGGEVKVTNTGNITVLGAGSYGIMAESINGGGGHLSLNFDSVEALFNLSCIPIPNAGGTCIPGTGGETGDRPPGAPLYSTRIGSTDSDDFNAGKITLINTGTIVTRGANSVGNAITAIGGGGGKLTLKTVLTTTATNPAPNTIMPVTFAISLGSLNGSNSKGGDIETTQAGMVVTTERNSAGVRMQSIGGGGGDSLTDLTAPTGTAIGTVDINQGSTNGTNLAAGTVQRIQTGAIATGGDYSTAVQLQSIGGGGGTSTVLINAADQTNLLVRTSLGADGGTGLGSSSVTGSYDGLQTEGNHAVALLAQSIGAGGGSVLTSGSNAVDVTLGAKNGATGNAGEINLTNTGTIQTSGIGSHAVLLQSIGGGGGAVLTDATTITTHLNSGNTGDGALVQFTQTGDIVATGAKANGLIAQSLGGGGGWVDGVFAGSAGGDGKGGAITLNLSGGTFATGTGGTAVLAQSLGKSGAGNISIVSGGTVRGYAAGIRVDGGATNTVTTSGSVSAVSGVTISAGSGNDRVINTGLVVGNIDLGSGSNAFENRAGSTFVAFSTIDLRDPAISSSALAIQSALPTAAIIPAPGGTFANDGDFLMGLSASPRPIDLAKGATFANLDANGNPANNLMYGSRVINTVALDGHFVQSDTGHMAFDVAYGPYASDRVNVTGNTTVDGTGDVTLTWLENAAPVTLFATAGTATDNGLDITDTIALDYRILANSNGIQLAFTSDFAQPFLNRNQGELGRHMDSAIALGGSGGIGRVMALLGNMQAGEEDAYAYVFDQLNPEPFLAPQTIQLGAARQFTADLNHCGATGQDTCVWARVGGTDVERAGDAENLDYTGAYDSLATGFERRVDDKWSIAGAIGFDHINRLYVGNGRASMEGDSLHAGVGATRTLGGVKLGLAVTGGLQTVETQRFQNIFEPLMGTATPHSSYVSAQAKLSRRFDKGAWFFEPSAALAVTSIHQGAFTEEGLEGQGAVGVSHTQTFATLTPELTVGYKVQESSGQTTAFSFNVGAVVHSTDRLEMPYRLVGSNQGSDPALISTEFDSDTIKMGANVQVTGKNDRTSLNLSVANESGKRYSQQTFSAAVKFKF